MVNQPTQETPPPPPPWPGLLAPVPSTALVQQPCGSSPALVSWWLPCNWLHSTTWPIAFHLGNMPGCRLTQKTRVLCSHHLATSSQKTSTSWNVPDGWASDWTLSVTGGVHFNIKVLNLNIPFSILARTGTMCTNSSSHDPDELVSELFCIQCLSRQ